MWKKILKLLETTRQSSEELIPPKQCEEEMTRSCEAHSLARSPPSPLLSLSAPPRPQAPPLFVLQQDITNYRPDPFLPTTVNSVGRFHLPFSPKITPLSPTVAHFLFVDWYHFFYLISFSFHYSLSGVCACMCLTLCLIYSSFVYLFVCVCERALLKINK
jgi:hypothetical protein